MQPLNRVIKELNYLLHVNRVFQSKTIVVIISAMRSGSTLLKALLAMAPDVSSLPETDFQAFNGYNKWKLNTLASEPIIVLKKPAFYTELATYPIIPKIQNIKKIILVRGVYDTVSSLKVRNKVKFPEQPKMMENHFLVNEYWCKTYASIINNPGLNDEDTLIIKYEDLTSKPIEITKKLFSFIDSRQTIGIDTYQPAKGYKWQWGRDDGGEVIKSLKVQCNLKKKDDLELINVIEQSKEVQIIRKHFGYLE